MRISELSNRSGVSVATIKYYIREELLPPGHLTAARQAEYDESHLRRLRLIRALIRIRKLSVNTTRDVLRALSESADTHLVLGHALGAIRATDDGAAGAERSPDVDALVEAMRWKVHDDAAARSTLAETLEALRKLGLPFHWTALLPYARLAEETARLDLDQLEGVTDPLDLAEQAIVLTVVLEPALLALRRMAQEHESALRHGD
jgi:DNA-binding transcriptional MerR regulator